MGGNPRSSSRSVVSAVLVIGLAACGGDRSREPLPPIGGDSHDPNTHRRALVDPNAPIPMDEATAERIAGVQWSMTRLEPAGHLCWAAAAVDDYHVAGRISARISFAAPVSAAPPAVTFTVNEPGSAVLTACMERALTAFRWPPPLAGEQIELPFVFTAPKGQYVIDRAMVPLVSVANTDDGSTSPRIATLITEKNSGATAANIVEMSLPAGSKVVGAAANLELWVALTPAAVMVKSKQKSTAVAAGDAVIIPSGTVRHFEAVRDQHWLGFVIADAGTSVAPFIAGGIVSNEKPAAVVWPTKNAQVSDHSGGTSRVIVSPRKKGDPNVSLVEQIFLAGTAAATHQHPSAELLYVTAGRGTVTVNGVTVEIGPSSVIQIPANALHSFGFVSEVHALQLFAPAGPELRYRDAR